MFLRLCFAVIAFASIFFTCAYCSNNKIDDKISIAIIIFEVFIFIAVEYQVWSN
mgnify:CR=1 FL=1